MKQKVNLSLKKKQSIHNVYLKQESNRYQFSLLIKQYKSIFSVQQQMKAKIKLIVCGGRGECIKLLTRNKRMKNKNNLKCDLLNIEWQGETH